MTSFIRQYHEAKARNLVPGPIQHPRHAAREMSIWVSIAVVGAVMTLVLHVSRAAL